jgi:hypothetical protein
MRRRNLRSLKQPRDSNSCGQTCVAMLTGASYDDVIGCMGEASTDTSAIRRGLSRFGFKSEKRLTQFRGNEEHPTPAVGIVGARPCGADRRPVAKDHLSAQQRASEKHQCFRCRQFPDFGLETLESSHALPSAREEQNAVERSTCAYSANRRYVSGSNCHSPHFCGVPGYSAAWRPSAQFCGDGRAGGSLYQKRRLCGFVGK